MHFTTCVFCNYNFCCSIIPFFRWGIRQYLEWRYTKKLFSSFLLFPFPSHPNVLFSYLLQNRILDFIQLSILALCNFWTSTQIIPLHMDWYFSWTWLTLRVYTLLHYCLAAGRHSKQNRTNSTIFFRYTGWIHKVFKHAENTIFTQWQTLLWRWKTLGIKYRGNSYNPFKRSELQTVGTMRPSEK